MSMSLPAASVSSDTIDESLTPSSPPPPMIFDHWSDDEREIQEVAPHHEDLAVGADKVTTADKTVEIETPSSPANIEHAQPEQEQEQEPASEADAGSVRSMPAVQVTEPSSPVPMTAQSASSSFPSTAPNPNIVSPLPAPQARRGRNRAALDPRSSNRLSGFFSSLIHPRRDIGPAPIVESSTPNSPIPTSSRASSPGPSRPSTPPPRLPPPTLLELGLSLASLTTTISPSHACGPPSSGAFLKPHYLLLCHAQGLDVLPLVSPPVAQPYALIRRVAFKSVVVMEHRGVLVAIAGRRNGVRVYALEDVRRAVEWRIDVEVRREQERTRREEAKRGLATATGQLHGEMQNSGEKMRERPPPLTPVSGPKKPVRRSSISIPGPGPVAVMPRSPTTRRPRTAEPSHPQPSHTVTSPPMGPPPAYSNSSPPREPEQTTLPASLSRSRATSLSDVLSGNLTRRQTNEIHVDRTQEEREDDSKADWASSDDEAINVVAAPSGSQVLDERTSSMAAIATTEIATDPPRIAVSRANTMSSIQRRNRPANLDLTMTRADPRPNVTQEIPPSPAPTLLTLRQALSISPQTGRTLATRANGVVADQDADADADEEDDGDPDPSSPTTPTRERVSLADMLMESRLPDLPPAGTRRPQEAIMLGSGTGTSAQSYTESLGSPRTSESSNTLTRTSLGNASSRRRRRWSVLDGIFAHSPTGSQSGITTLQEDEPLDRISSSVDGHTVVSETTTAVESPPQLSRIQSESSRSQPSRIQPSNSGATIRPSTSHHAPVSAPTPAFPPGRAPRERSATIGNMRPSTSPPMQPTTRFLPRLITNAFQSRRSDDTPIAVRGGEIDFRRANTLPPPPQAPAPKLEYAKLPGTKGAVLIKAVETPKKSFLAILCGENGEKVELFAGTYRTALQLSRTFILPDSPRSLELQLQGDDLVEVFLVFTQNVFGLEPATVRVREVRIGRAERRAARRRARGNRADQTGDADTEGAGAPDDDTQVNVNIVAPPTPSAPDAPSPGLSPDPAPAVLPQTPDAASAQSESATVTGASTDELVSQSAAAGSNPYTTFQQLSFAPNFPLATIADDYIIPPTYAAFLEYRNAYEPEVNGDPNVDLSQVQFSPPGLPVPVPAPPSKWFYRDPKGVIHGPWKATLMQAWYRDGMLPPDLPVRREEDFDYTLLKDLRLQCVDPTHPFRSSPPLPGLVPHTITDSSKPLLHPISLLCQPRHFGPPALFYSSRGGHSTAIVDARGRSVLKGRFVWSSDDQDDFSIRMGDVKRLEAFDVEDRAVLVAMRQGGLEALDFGDALLRPADYSRTTYPHFQPSFHSVSRRGPYVWKIGTPLSSQPSVSSSASLSLPSSKSLSSTHRKKTSTGPARSPRSDFSLSGDGDSDRIQEEMLFLGRKDDEMYLCEKRVGSFRILRLAPSSAPAPSQRPS